MLLLLKIAPEKRQAPYLYVSALVFFFFFFFFGWPASQIRGNRRFLPSLPPNSAESILPHIFVEVRRWLWWSFSFPSFTKWQRVALPPTKNPMPTRQLAWWRLPTLTAQRWCLATTTTVLSTHLSLWYLPTRMRLRCGLQEACNPRLSSSVGMSVATAEEATRWRRFCQKTTS